MRSITELDFAELEQLLVQWGEKIYHARQIFAWIYKRGISGFDSMSDLPAALRNRLQENFTFLDLKLIKSIKAKDGTEKFIFSLENGKLIEAVVIPTENRITACISSQAGCKYSCVFCASGLGGFKRNLTCGEIIQQLLYLNKHRKITHIVFMGMGEPLDNYDNVLKAIRSINSKEGLNIGARKITVSTNGIIPGIGRLAREGLQLELSVSLHSADDKIRSEIMPVNKIYRLEDLISACSRYIKKTGRQITFEYILIKNLNSDLENARKLTAITKELRLVKVNLIPVNPVKEYGIEPPPKSEVVRFKGYLIRHGVNAIIRKQRGEDIDAACGQLRARYEKRK